MMYRLLRPLLFRLDPEHAQSLAIEALRVLNQISAKSVNPQSTDGVNLLGLRFPNRIGLAAGFDKSARHIDVLGGLGFGFIEVGTVTPRPQPGNPRPNLFRLVEDRALINRMGFNNDGAEAVARRLEKRRYRGICGVNIGKNFDTPLNDAASDYVACLRTVYAVADYIAVNVSSPNTPGLRDLQGPEAMRTLIAELMNAREQLQAIHGKRVPMLIKIAPDFEGEGLLHLVQLFEKLRVDGVIATNTTIQRPMSLRSRYASQEGGLSGLPLHAQSGQVIQTLRNGLGLQFPIIGVGGIMSETQGRATLEAGANLLQVYTGLVYEGPTLIRKLSDLSADAGSLQ